VLFSKHHKCSRGQKDAEEDYMGVADGAVFRGDCSYMVAVIGKIQLEMSRKYCN